MSSVSPAFPFSIFHFLAMAAVVVVAVILAVSWDVGNKVNISWHTRTASGEKPRKRPRPRRRPR